MVYVPGGRGLVLLLEAKGVELRHQAIHLVFGDERKIFPGVVRTHHRRLGPPEHDVLHAFLRLLGAPRRLLRVLVRHQHPEKELALCIRRHVDRRNSRSSVYSHFMG